MNVVTGKWVLSAIATETLPYRKVGVECNTETGLPYCIRSCMPMTAAVIRGDKFYCSRLEVFKVNLNHISITAEAQFNIRAVTFTFK